MSKMIPDPIFMARLKGLRDDEKALEIAHWERMQEMDEMDPRKVELKCPPTPFTGRDPGVTIPLATHLHIIRDIVSYADKDALLSLRSTCKFICKLVDREYARDLLIRERSITSRSHGYIPSLRFKGNFMLYASFTNEGEEYDAELSRAREQNGDPPTDLWLGVHPTSAEWLAEFLRDVHTVQMLGCSISLIARGTREDEGRTRSAQGQVFIDLFSAQHVRMSPLAGEKFADYSPFTSPFLTHDVPLLSPWPDTRRTWLFMAPPIPGGTTHLTLHVHLNPFLRPHLEACNHLRFPASLKTLSINLIPQGHPHIECATLQALTQFWVKVFHNFRPGIKVFVHNLHR